MAIQSDREQLVLELINRARLDPAGEAARLGIDLNEGLAPGTLTAAAKQPLAMQDLLVTAARGHSQAMIDQDFFAHVNPATGKGPQQRANDAGYSGNVGENIAFSGNTGPINATALVIQMHDALFVDTGIDGRGHRKNILFESYKEIGNGVATGDFTQGGQTFNAVMLTEDFGIPTNSSMRFITGVAFNDSVLADSFYSVGEGRANVVVTASASTTTGSSGGYSLAISGIAQQVTFSGGGLANSITVALAAGTSNVKLDVFNGNTVLSSGDITLVSGATAARLLGVGDLAITGGSAAETLTGNSGRNTLMGNDGNDTLLGGLADDTLNGGAGFDIARYSGLRSAYTISQNGPIAAITGPEGSDTLTGIERLQFDDSIVDLEMTIRRVRVDFGADGKSDLVIRNDTSGDMQLLQMNGLNYSAYKEYAWGTHWQVVDAQSDFNGDGQSDLVIANDTTGDIQLLQMNGLNYSAYQEFIWGPHWFVVGAHGDFNADGKSDLAIRNDVTGDIQLLQMNGLNYTAYSEIKMGLSWHLVDAQADFNGDGKSDLVLANDTTGDIQLLQMNGLSSNGSQEFKWGPHWQVVASHGDFNGDGKSDLVIQHDTTGDIQLLQMDGMNYTAYLEFKWGPHWHVIDAEPDFNGDGKSDLVIANDTTGDIQLLQMNGLNYTAYQEFKWGPHWHVLPEHTDFNGDGKSDLVIRHDVSGDMQLLQMNGLNYVAYQEIIWGSHWQVANAGGEDWVIGDAGNNVLHGGPGNDVLSGLEGADTLTGGPGNDLLIGGPGGDTFTYGALSDRGTTTGDVISDFSKAEGDILNLHELLQSFSGYTGANAFSGGYLQLLASGANTLVQVDAEGSINATHSFVTLATLSNALLTGNDAANLVL